MKLTVGGSFHGEGWIAVCNTVKKLQSAGHQILAPRIDAKIIDPNADYVKFIGEENISAQELQMMYFSCIEKSDGYVIANPNSYQGFMVSTEFGWAMQCIINNSFPLKKIYLTDVPLGYDKFKSNPRLSFDTFLNELYRNPNYQNELTYFKKHCPPNGFFGYNSEEDFYYDLINMHTKILYLESIEGLVIGLGSLLNKNKQSNQISTLDDSEPEL